MPSNLQGTPLCLKPLLLTARDGLRSEMQEKPECCSPKQASKSLGYLKVTSWYSLLSPKLRVGVGWASFRVKAAPYISNLLGRVLRHHHQAGTKGLYAKGEPGQGLPGHVGPGRWGQETGEAALLLGPWLGHSYSLIHDLSFLLKNSWNSTYFPLKISSSFLIWAVIPPIPTFVPHNCTRDRHWSHILVQILVPGKVTSSQWSSVSSSVNETNGYLTELLWGFSEIM